MKRILSQRYGSRWIGLAAGVLLALWIILNFRALWDSEDGMVRSILGAIFFLVILLRPKPVARNGLGVVQDRGTIVNDLALAASGIVLVITGIVFAIHTILWLGILLITYVGLRYALLPAVAPDLGKAMFILFWIHPLPYQILNPFRFGLQRLSVEGAGWLLQFANIRVWVDGFVLRAGTLVFEVPEACSGMRAVTTVFMLCLGLGLLKRLKWPMLTGLVLVAWGQALILNVLRIAVGVILVSRLGGFDVAEFYHTSLGILLLFAVVAVYFDVTGLEAWLRRRQAQRQARADYAHADTPQRAISYLPAAWQFIKRRSWVSISVAAAIAVVGIAIYRSRPYHRAEMIKEVALVLGSAGQYENALRAAMDVQCLVPQDVAWRLEVVKLMLARRQFGAALSELDDTAMQSDQVHRIERAILAAYANMGLDRRKEVTALLKNLPPQAEDHPMLAMINAEFAAADEQPDRVAELALRAAQWAPNTPRIRRLFPVLAKNRNWRVIMAAHSNLPHETAEQALIAAEAAMNLNQPEILAGLLTSVLPCWPDDVRFLTPLFFLAVKQPGGRWEDALAQLFVRGISHADNPDLLYPLFEKCFQLRRPDLAWSLYLRLKAIAPQHPYLAMAVVRYGNLWFAVRRQALSMPTDFALETVDIRPLLRKVFAHPWSRNFSRRLPLAVELTADNVEAVRRDYLRQALAGFARLGRDGKLSLPVWYEYALALEMADRIPEAADQLTAIALAYPTEADVVRLRRAEIYRRLKDWQTVYEILRGYPGGARPDLTPLTILCEAQRCLMLNLPALVTATTAYREFPDSTQAKAMLADTLLVVQCPEEALWLLSRKSIRLNQDLEILRAEALFATERYMECKRYCSTHRLQPPDYSRAPIQRLITTPAEQALTWHRSAIPGEKDFERAATMIQRNLPGFTSPFLRDCCRLWLDCYAAHSRGSVTDMARWLACGRDPVEQATALLQLTMLLCREGDYVRAEQVAARAAGLLPQSPFLWRAWISLAEGRPEVIAAARSACPLDPEIWLAWLITEVRRGGDETRIRAALNDAITAENMPVGTITRAGDFLLRKGMPSAAMIAARYASANAQGFAPAHFLLLRCAGIANDRESALLAAQRASDAALEPPLFCCKVIVDLKGLSNPKDTDVYDALKQLRRRDYTNPRWAEMLGYIYFQRSGMDIGNALTETSFAIDGGATSKVTFVIAAESARLIRDYDRALKYLRKGYERYPGDVVFLNNLVQALSMRPETMGEARARVDHLLNLGASNPAVLDTAAVVYLHSGDWTGAEKLLAQALALAPRHSPEWMTVRLHQAELQYKRGALKEAKVILDDLGRNSQKIPDSLLYEFDNLRNQVSTALDRR